MSGELMIPESQQIMIQIDAANKYPRKLDSFAQDCVALATKSNKIALSCIYCRPVGKKNGRAEFAMGPSVRLTEIMQGFWKHIYAGYQIEIDGDVLKARGVCCDMQSNVRRYAEATKSLKKRDGQMVSESQQDVMAKALGSIVTRDAILQVIGRAYADEVSEQIMDHVLQDGTGAWDYAVSCYAELGVSKEDLCNYLGCKANEQPENEAIWKAIGIYNYLKDSGESPDYVFGTGRQSSKPTVTPDQVKDVKKAAGQKAPAKKAATEPAQKTKPQQQQANVMGSEEFEQVVFSMLLTIGMTEQQLNAALDAEFSIAGGIKNIPADQQNAVLKWIESQQDTPGA